MIWQFDYPNGLEGKITVVSDLLDTEERAKQRAIAEFIIGGTEKNYIEFDTYRTDLKVGQVVRVEGQKYRVVSILTKTDQKTMISIIRGVRYGT